MDIDSDLILRYSRDNYEHDVGLNPLLIFIPISVSIILTPLSMPFWSDHSTPQSLHSSGHSTLLLTMGSHPTILSSSLVRNKLIVHNPQGLTKRFLAICFLGNLLSWHSRSWDSPLSSRTCLLCARPCLVHPPPNQMFGLVVPMAISNRRRCGNQLHSWQSFRSQNSLLGERRNLHFVSERHLVAC